MKETTLLNGTTITQRVKLIQTYLEQSTKKNRNKTDIKMLCENAHYITRTQQHHFNTSSFVINVMVDFDDDQDDENVVNKFRRY